MERFMLLVVLVLVLVQASLSERTQVQRIRSPTTSDMVIPQISVRDINTRRSLFKLQDDFVDVCFGNLTSPQAIQDGNIFTNDVYSFVNLVDEKEYLHFNDIPVFIQLEWMWALCPPSYRTSVECFEKLEEMNEKGDDYGFLLNPDDKDSVYHKVKNFCRRIWWVYRTTGKFLFRRHVKCFHPKLNRRIRNSHNIFLDFPCSFGSF